MTQTTSITVHAHGKTFDLALDNKYASASQMIPLITRLFSKEPNTVVTSRSLHARLGKTYKHNSWLERVKKDCRLTLNEDYWEEEADPNSIEDRRLLAQNAGKPLTLTYFSLKAARKITLLSGSDEGHAFYEFVDAVLEAITPKLLDEIREMNILICSSAQSSSTATRPSPYRPSNRPAHRRSVRLSKPRSRTDCSDVPVPNPPCTRQRPCYFGRWPAKRGGPRTRRPDRKPWTTCTKSTAITAI
jgi:phage anti-repressor protein